MCGCAPRSSIISPLQNVALDPVGWSHLSRAAFDRLHTLLAEQRRLAFCDQTAIMAMLDELDDELHGNRLGRLAASPDRRAAGQNRRSSGRDRDDAAGDRDLSARDRGPAPIEREKLGSAELEHGSAGGPDEPAHFVVAEARRKVAESRARIDRFLGPTDTSASLPRDPPGTGDN